MFERGVSAVHICICILLLSVIPDGCGSWLLNFDFTSVDSRTGEDGRFRTGTDGQSLVFGNEQVFALLRFVKIEKHSFDTFFNPTLQTRLPEVKG